MWYIQTMEYYSAIKRNDINATMWMNLQNIMLSEKVRHKGSHMV